MLFTMKILKYIINPKFSWVLAIPSTSQIFYNTQISQQETLADEALSYWQTVIIHRSGGRLVLLVTLSYGMRVGGALHCLDEINANQSVRYYADPRYLINTMFVHISYDFITRCDSMIINRATKPLNSRLAFCLGRLISDGAHKS